MSALPQSFAIIQVGGHQYKVTEGDEIMVEKLDAPITSKILLDKILMVGTREHTVVGTPMLTKAKVYAQVEEQSRTEKLIVYMKRSDTKSGRSRSGHRQDYTLLKILGVMVENE
uniref:Large ribosomal subunit protein bL21m n=1 Tax=Arcella intermedia TaxID=1963864 RepID=A0A6B2LS48_9EUKA